MTSEMVIDGKTYIPSKDAATQTGYTQDYIGQLARAGSIDARRIGGLWYVFLESLTSYKKKADSYVPTPPGRQNPQDVDSFVSFDGQDYVSAARAAELTGYAQDYVGQLAREGTVLGRQVGNRWYVAREALIKHKADKDALLGAVQAESVGISREKPSVVKVTMQYNDPNKETHYNYKLEESDLLPTTKSEQLKTEPEAVIQDIVLETKEELPDDTVQSIPIHVVERPISSKQVGIKSDFGVIKAPPSLKSTQKTSRITGKTYSMAFSGAAVLLVIVLAGYFSFISSRGPITDPTVASQGGQEVQAASAGSARGGFLGLLENILAPEIFYKRLKKG